MKTQKHNNKLKKKAVKYGIYLLAVIAIAARTYFDGRKKRR
jgi:hypothetical protein